MKQFQKIYGVAFILILAVSMFGCEMLGPEHSGGPTAPADGAPNPADLANFWVGRGQDKFGITQEGTGSFTVSVLAGSYLLEYWTYSGGPFYIVFKADTSVSLTIGIQEENLLTVTLYHGEITDGATELATRGTPQRPVLIFAWPADPDVGWDSVFDADPYVEPIVLFEGGGVVGDGVGDGDGDGGDGRKCTITVEPPVGGTIKPAGPTITKPCGSSHSFKFKPGPPALTCVTIDGGSVFDLVQKLGNGDGHLVIHKIDRDITLTGYWGPPCP